MYILEIRKVGSRGKVSEKNIRCFDNFDFLMSEKLKLEMKNFKCDVFKVENNGKDVSRLKDLKNFKKSDDFEVKRVKDCYRELYGGFKRYKTICDDLWKCGERNFYVERCYDVGCDVGKGYDNVDVNVGKGVGKVRDILFIFCGKVRKGKVWCERCVEVERVTSSPRYEIRENSVILTDILTSQNDCVDCLFYKDKQGKITKFKKRIDKKNLEVRYH